MKNETKRAAPTAFILSFSSYLADDCVCLNPGHGRRKDLAFQRVPAEAGDSSLTPFGLFFFGGGGGGGGTVEVEVEVEKERALRSNEFFLHVFLFSTLSLLLETHLVSAQARVSSGF